MFIYLYLKTHNKTGLKYLGQTTKNPQTYLGSGVYWLRHLKEHGEDILTEILYETTSYDEIKEKGLYYSNLWDIVNNTNFANLIPETGCDGIRGLTKDKLNPLVRKKHSDNWKKQIEKEKERWKINYKRS
jgi:hypothetical protein